MPDLRFSSHGSIVTIAPETERGRQWMDDNLAAESWQWLGNSLGVEWRFAEDIFNGALGDGLEVENG